MAKREFNRKPKIEEDEFEKKLIEVRRVVKVVKGGRTLRFSALVVVGDKKGRVGLGIAKATEVPVAIEKAQKIAKKTAINVPIIKGSIPHDIIGKFGTTKLVMLSGKEGAGLISGGAARSVLELAGYTNITTKIHGSNNKINCVRAAFDGLKKLRTAEQIAFLRGKSVEEL